MITNGLWSFDIKYTWESDMKYQALIDKLSDTVRNPGSLIEDSKNAIVSLEADLQKARIVIEVAYGAFGDLLSPYRPGNREPSAPDRHALIDLMTRWQDESYNVSQIKAFRPWPKEWELKQQPDPAPLTASGPEGWPADGPGLTNAFEGLPSVKRDVRVVDADTCLNEVLFLVRHGLSLQEANGLDGHTRKRFCIAIGKQNDQERILATEC